MSEITESNTTKNLKLMPIEPSNERDESQKLKERAKQYEKEQKEKLEQYIVGSTDYAGNKITRIYARGDEFVIYETHDVPIHESLRVYIQSKDENDESIVMRFQKSKQHFDEFIAHCYRYNCSSIYRKRAATILSSILLGINDPIKNNFQKINEDIKNDYKNMITGRNYYQLGAIFFTLAMLILSMIIYISRSTEFIANNYFIPVIVYAATFASMGGFISVSLKIRTLQTDKELQKKTYFLYGVERILFSVIAGIIVYFMLKGNLVFGFLNVTSDISFTTYVICTLSGFSETLIPNTLRNLEQKSEND
ncbi:hypothetical protein [Escherichia coli]|uniref:hypothetical protein n=1 Tax=Escherichia coli TaxID=562 RepID=UPI001FCEB0DD|nr:hypothetical protein [Escherichia coli]